MSLAYRPEIDGLRAIAVTSVVVFHGFPHALTGGYVGVDIFFVISGYLICSILKKSTLEGRFSLLDFYERRARRILPALTVMILAVLVAGYVILIPGIFESLGESVVATMLFASNVYFYLTMGDYFADSAEYAPLLHTWSLGVEEQFYLVAPLVIYGSIRYLGLRFALWMMIGLSALSLGLSIATSARDNAFAFYLPFTRVYELGIGGILALMPPPRLSRPMREVLGGTGLVMMALAFAFFDAGTVFPGGAALLPCLGAALVIAGTDRTTLTGRLLSLRPVVYVGLLSYSWYLWHWPVLVMARQYYVTLDLASGLVVACLALSFGLAVLSLHFVEGPFRRRRIAATRSSVFTLSGIILSASVAVGLMIWTTGGLPARMPTEVRNIVATMDKDLDLSGGLRCRTEGLAKICRNRMAEANLPIRSILLGDSHMQVLAPDLLRAMDSEGIAAEAVFRGGCPPLSGVVIVAKQRAKTDCDRFMTQALDRIAATPDLEQVVLHARWALYGSGERAGRETGGPLFLAPLSQMTAQDISANLPLLENRIASLVDRFAAQGADTVIVGSVPEIGWHVARTLTNHVRFGIAVPDIPFAEDFAPDRRGMTDARLAQMAQMRETLSYIPVTEIFCMQTCSFWDARREYPLYSDSNHLTPAGTRRLTTAVFPTIVTKPPR